MSPIQQMFLGLGAGGDGGYWFVTYTAASNSGNGYNNAYRPERFALDSSGNIYLAGRCKDYATFGNDFDEDGGHVIQIKKDGTLGWLRLIGTIAQNFAYDVTLDSAKNVYVAGKLAQNTSGLTEPGYISKYNSSGAHQNLKSTNNHRLQVIAATSASFPTGYSTTSYYANNSQISGPGGTGEYRIWYNPTISNPWRLSFGTDSSQATTSKALTDYLTSNYSGEYIIGPGQDAAGPSRFFEILKVTSSSTGECLVTGGAYQGGYPPSICLQTIANSVQWAKKLDYTPYSSGMSDWDARITDIKIDSNHNIYVLSKAKRDTNRRRSIISKWHPSGNMLWARIIGNPNTNNKEVTLNSLDFDSNNDVICVGVETYDYGSKCFVIKYNQAGEQQWQRRIKTGTNHVRDAQGVAIDTSDSNKIFIVGYGNTIAGGGGNRWWIYQTNADCTSILNQKTFNTTNPSGADERCYHIKIKDDAMYMSGYKYGQLQTNTNIMTGFVVKVPKDFSLTGTYGYVTYGNATGNSQIVTNPNIQQAPIVRHIPTSDWEEFTSLGNITVTVASNSTGSITNSNPNFDTEVVE